MPSKEELKRSALTAIDRRKADIIGVARAIYQSPETGYHEFNTSRLVAQRFSQMGISHRQGLAITGVKGHVPGGAGAGPRVAVIGELDALPVPDHPYADPQTGAAHACGHAAQIGMMLGTMVGLLDSGVKSHLSGTVVPFAVPAEEFVEIDKRLALRDQGKVQFLDGKQELIRLGEFDDVDMAIMCHTSSSLGDNLLSVGGTTNGNVLKYVQFIGKGSHAGGAPHLGINALNAACWAIMAIHSNRETFRGEDVVRIHGIIQRGGDVVSAVPHDVRLEWRVRSADLDAVVKNSAIVDRCFKAGAMAVGAAVKITTVAGSLPLRNDPSLEQMFMQNAGAILGQDRVNSIPATSNHGGSTDMGDLSHIMPVCHPHTAGAEGPGHSKDYLITDWDFAVINPARVMATVVIDLLAEGAAGAQGVLSRFKPAMTKEQYIRFQQERMSVVEFDGVGE